MGKELKKEDYEWIYEYDSLTINRTKYYFRCVWSFDKKTVGDDRPSMQLVFNIFDDTAKEWINFSDFKGSYLAEKFIDYVKNTINGQRSVYWDNKVGRNFGKETTKGEN